MSKNGVFEVIISPQIMGVFQNFFCIKFSVRSMNVPNFIEMQNTWCNFWKKFAHLAWNDPSTIGTGVMELQN